MSSCVTGPTRSRDVIRLPGRSPGCRPRQGVGRNHRPVEYNRSLPTPSWTSATAGFGRNLAVSHLAGRCRFRGCRARESGPRGRRTEWLHAGTEPRRGQDRKATPSKRPTARKHLCPCSLPTFAHSPMMPSPASPTTRMGPASDWVGPEGWKQWRAVLTPFARCLPRRPLPSLSSMSSCNGASLSPKLSQNPSICTEPLARPDTAGPRIATSAGPDGTIGRTVVREREHTPPRSAISSRRSSPGTRKLSPATWSSARAELVLFGPTRSRGDGLGSPDVLPGGVADGEVPTVRLTKARATVTNELRAVGGRSRMCR